MEPPGRSGKGPGHRSYIIIGALLLLGVVAQAGPAVAELSVPGSVEPSGIARDTVTAPLTRPDQVHLVGDVPRNDFPNIQVTSDSIWTYLVERFGVAPDRPAPMIYFHPFDKTSQSDDWTAWQKDWTRAHPVIWRDWTALREKGAIREISQEWIDANIDDIFPFPKTFLAFHYDGTNRIQINPARTFLTSVQLDPYGVRRDLDGRGYYSLAHEMLHYVLELKGVVPTKLHHCLMVHDPVDGNGVALMKEVADHLVDSDVVAASAGYRGLHSERAFSPCAQLTNDERREVEQRYSRLASSTGPSSPALARSTR